MRAVNATTGFADAEIVTSLRAGGIGILARFAKFQDTLDQISTD